jgi:hypothetical protein
MPGDDDAIRGEIEAPVALVGRVTEQGAQGRARSKFVRGGGSKVGVTCVSKNPKVMVGGEGAMEGEKGSAHV